MSVLSRASTRRMRMLGAMTGALVVAGAVLAAPTFAMRTPPPPVVGTGSVQCAVTGGLTFSPALTALGTGGPSTVTLKVHLKTCTGTGNGANVRAGTVTVSGTAPSSSCTTLADEIGGGVPTTNSGSITWTALARTPKLAASTVELAAAAGNAGPPIVVDSSGEATGGSFSGDTAAAHTVLRQTATQLAKLCFSARGLKTVPFAPGSTFSLASPPAA